MKNTIHITLLLCFICCFTKNNFANDNDSTKAIVADTTKQEKYFGPAEVMPSYPGGIGAMMTFIIKNLVYPKDAKRQDLEGKVTVKFYIDVDGTVKDPIVLKNTVGTTSAEVEAVRLVNLFPKWKPGSQRGKPVKVYYTIPISFKLN